MPLFFCYANLGGAVLTLPSEEEMTEIENNVYRKSLDLMSEHIRKVQDTVRVLINAFDNFLGSQLSDLESDSQKIAVMEEDADKIKRELIEQLTKAAPSLLYREDFLRLVVMVDEIAESSQSISRLMVRMAKNKWIPNSSFAEGIKMMSLEVLSTFEALRDAILTLIMNPRRAIQLVPKVHEYEARVDEIYHDLDFKALTEVKQIERLLIFRDLLWLLEHMADNIEDASDDLRVLALHRVA
jgi:predicted phosphate transport protein (TIGR00153 family)